jgi:hypothetical protein
MFFNYWGYDSGSMFIAAVDYTVYDTYVKINHLCVNESDNHDITEHEFHELVSALIWWVETEAKKYNKPKLIVSVENNLEMYGKYYSSNGFVLSYGNCVENPIWIDAELQVDITQK